MVSATRSRLGIHGIQSAFSRGRVVRGVEVEHLAIVLQSLQSVCKALRDQHGQPVVVAQLDAEPGEIRGRSRAEVDCDIENAAFDTGDDLGLGHGMALEMQAAHSAASAGDGPIDLTDAARNARFAHLALAVHAFQKATVVAQRLTSNHQQIGQRRRVEIEAHGHPACLA